MMHGLRRMGGSGPEWLLARLLALAAWLLFGPICHVAMADPLDRIQLHHAPGRGMPYRADVPTNADPGGTLLAMRVAQTIRLDGNPLENVYANLLPIDVDGDGAYEFLHFNGFRFMQVWSADGRKLWRIVNPAGRVHDYVAGTQRDSAIVLDVDGDGRQEIVHCWVQSGRRLLTLRRGGDGSVLRTAALNAGSGEECQLGAFRMAPSGAIQIVVADKLSGAAASACKHNWVGYWARTAAFDVNLTRRWERDTCDAGHFLYPLDMDRDGAAEGVYVGKFLLGADGGELCRLEGWDPADHVDSLSIADIDPVQAGEEAFAVGRTGTALFHAATCRRIWTLPKGLLRNPQHLGLARLDPARTTPILVVEERGSELMANTAVLDGAGRLLAKRSTSYAPGQNSFMPMANAELDGAQGVEELVGSFGEVLGRDATLRLDKSWYWGLKGVLAESSLGYYPMDFDRWQAFPLVFDYDHDGRDEIVTWGQSLIVIGKQDASLTPPTPRPAFEPLPSGPAASDSLLWLRYVASYPDLIKALGPDAARAKAHYEATGRFERRAVTFDPQRYLARNAWLRTATGGTSLALTRHYINQGYAKGLTWLDAPLRWLRYIASYGDLIYAYGPLASAGELHWAAQGQAEGRTIQFNPTGYLTQTPAAASACNGNLACATIHYINAKRADPPR